MVRQAGRIWTTKLSGVAEKLLGFTNNQAQPLLLLIAPPLTELAFRSEVPRAINAVGTEPPSGTV